MLKLSFNYQKGTTMKLLIAGSRTITYYELIRHTLITLNYNITEIVSGGAKGVDKLGERFAKENNIPIKQFLPDWNTYGKKAGIIRNVQMVDYCDLAIFFWDGESKGTKFTIMESIKHNKLSKVYMLEV
jgi:hypothetical protein